MNRERSYAKKRNNIRQCERSDEKTGERRQGKDRRLYGKRRLCYVIAQEVHETLSSRWQIVDRGRFFILGP